MRRSATHEAGHAHGLSHAGESDALRGGLGGFGPQLTGCFARDGITSDDRAQYANERDQSTHTANVGFENGRDFYDGTGNWQVSTANPARGMRHAVVPKNSSLASRWTRVTSHSTVQTARLRYKATRGSSNFKFSYREVNYGGSGPNCVNSFSPRNFDWDRPSASAVRHQIIETLPSSLRYTSVSEQIPNLPNSDAIDMRLAVVAPNNSSGLYVDEMELR